MPLTTRKELMNARLVVSKCNPKVFLSSKSKRRDDYFYVVKDDEIWAHIYLRKNTWYLWDVNKLVRTKVKSFQAACDMAEEICEA